MTPKPKRPLSVWIAQIILGIYALGISLLVLWGVFKALTEGVPNPSLYLVTTVGILTFAGIYAGGFWGMAIRKRWGRWLGVVGLSILTIGAAIKQTTAWFSPSETPSSFVSIGFVFSVFAVLGLAILTYLIAAGDAAEEFFNGGKK
jgi:hypothetical protein